MSRRRQNKKQLKEIAQKRIKILFDLAEQQALANNFILADRYVHLARKIAMKHLVSIPKEYKRRFCKYCYSYLLPEKTCRVRVHNKRVITHCFRCKKIIRIPIK